jgi:nucleoside-diphosphate-sugar epimerase
VSNILVLGGCGEMGSAAVADLVERTGHEVRIGDLRPDASAELPRRFLDALADRELAVSERELR